MTSSLSLSRPMRTTVSNCPTPSQSASVTSIARCWPPAGIKVGSLATISVQAADGPRPVTLVAGEVTALEAEYRPSGTFTIVRGYDPAHRFFRGRATASLPADDRLRHRHAGRAERPVCRSVRSTQTTTVSRPRTARPARPTGSSCRSSRGPDGLEVSVREGKFSFLAPPEASAAPSPTGPASPQPLVLALGSGPAAIPVVAHVADQVERGRGPRLGPGKRRRR